jgi:hypothetical protein
MMKFSKLAVLGAFAAIAPFASATPLVPGALPVAPGPTTILAATSGSNVGSAGGSLSTPTYSATWSENVYKGATGNIFGVNDLTFVFSFTNVVCAGCNPNDPLTLATASSFMGFSTDADVVVPATGSAPYDVKESTSGVVNFDFLAVSPGSTSDTLVLYTNALYMQPGIFSLHDNFGASAADLAPAIEPEPSSLILFGTGLVSAAGMLVRRRRNS